jgi:hypothetical protein
MESEGGKSAVGRSHGRSQENSGVPRRYLLAVNDDFAQT